MLGLAFGVSSVERSACLPQAGVNPERRFLPRLKGLDLAPSNGSILLFKLKRGEGEK